MSANSSLNIGIVGACGRGGSFRHVCAALGVRVYAVCDIKVEALEQARTTLGADRAYADYAAMLADPNVDAVIVGTPMPLHAPQSIAAIEAGKHVISEVPAAVSIAESRDLVRAAKASRGIYMMAENYTYTYHSILVRSLLEQGAFGTPYYAEGEYLHELKGLNEITSWRRKWQTGINGITYGSHSLGPILQWFAGDRVESVCCAGSGQHHLDPRGAAYENEASCVMLGKMRGGGLVKIRVDMLSDRPHAMQNYQLQGSDGCFESARAHGESHRIWLRELGDVNKWTDLATLDHRLPDWYKEGRELSRKAGHGGGDYFEIVDFVNAVTGKAPCPIGIHEAMDMTLPGLVSQQSIAQGGAWLTVPDSRQW